MKKLYTLAVTAFVVAGWFYGQAAWSASSGNFYVRGEGGVSWARDANFRDDNPNAANCFLVSSTPTGIPCTGTLNDLGTGWGLGAGVGYRFASNLRADITYTHRDGFKLEGRDPGGTLFDAKLMSDVFMLNGIYELPVAMGSVKPFVGLGIGRARNELKQINWSDPPFRGTLPGGTKNDFAWQFMAGGDIAMAPGWVLEVFYRYADLGKFQKNAGPDIAGVFWGPIGTGSATGKLRTNELMVGLRYEFR